MLMFGIFLHAVFTTLGGLFIGGSVACVFWALLGWTRYPGLGPAAAFVTLALLLHPNDFTQMILLFSALFGLGGLASLAVGRRVGKTILDPSRSTLGRTKPL